MKLCSIYPLHASIFHSLQPTLSAPLISAVVPPKHAYLWYVIEIVGYQLQPARIAGWNSIIKTYGRLNACNTRSVGGNGLWLFL